MTYEDWIIAVAADAPRRSGTALKLLLHLAATSIQTGSNQVRASDRELETQLDVCRPALTDAKRTLGDVIRIESRPGVPSVFTLPADWFPGQRTLFPQQVARFSSHQWPGLLATTGQENRPPVASLVSHSGQESLPGGQENRPPVANISGQSGKESWPPGQESLPPATQNQQVTAGSSIESNSNSVVIPTEVQVEIDRVLETVEIPAPRRDEAAQLRLHLHTFMRQRGDARAAQKTPSDEIVAKCLACGTCDQLVATLHEVAENANTRPGAYIWFVVVFLQRLRNVPWKFTKIRMAERRQRKPPQRAEPLPFPAQITNQLVSGVKRLS